MTATSPKLRNGSFHRYKVQLSWTAVASRKKKRGQLCDLEANFRDVANEHQSSTKICYISYPRMRSDSVGVTLSDYSRSSIAATASWSVVSTT